MVTSLALPLDAGYGRFHNKIACVLGRMRLVMTHHRSVLSHMRALVAAIEAC